MNRVGKSFLGGVLILFLLLSVGLGALKWQNVSEWTEVNLLTVSTKQKQAKYLEFANKRFGAFTRDSMERDLRKYQDYMSRARYMAEVILFLDGAELDVMKNVEVQTREQERAAREWLESAGGGNREVLREALEVARSENRQAFEYMVSHYQITSEDIENYGEIVRGHILFVQDSGDLEVLSLINEARNHLEAGLNLRAYEIVDQAKNIYYSNF